MRSANGVLFSEGKKRKALAACQHQGRKEQCLFNHKLMPRSFMVWPLSPAFLALPLSGICNYLQKAVRKWCLGHIWQLWAYKSVIATLKLWLKW